jgi:hypothetical protein
MLPFGPTDTNTVAAFDSDERSGIEINRLNRQKISIPRFIDLTPLGWRSTGKAVKPVLWAAAFTAREER